MPTRFLVVLVTIVAFRGREENVDDYGVGHLKVAVTNGKSKKAGLKPGTYVIPYLLL